MHFRQPDLQLTSRVRGDIDITIAKEDHDPIGLNLRGYHVTAGPTPTLEQATRNISLNHFRDPDKITAFCEDLEQVVVPPWGSDLNSHHQLLDRQIQPSITRHFPPQVKPPTKKLLTDATLDIHQSKTMHRTAKRNALTQLEADLLLAYFLVWRLAYITGPP